MEYLWSLMCYYRRNNFVMCFLTAFPKRVEFECAGYANNLIVCVCSPLTEHVPQCKVLNFPTTNCANSE